MPMLGHCWHHAASCFVLTNFPNSASVSHSHHLHGLLTFVHCSKEIEEEKQRHSKTHSRSIEYQSALTRPVLNLLGSVIQGKLHCLQ